MKAQTFDTRSIEARPGGHSSVARGLLAQARGLEILAMLATRTAIALIPAVSLVTAAVLAVNSPDWVIYLQAALWVGGFLFIALAMESESAASGLPNLAIGIALPVLTWLSATLAPELAVAAAALVAAWFAIVMFRWT